MVKFYTDSSQLTSENRRRVFPMLFDWFYLEQSNVKDFFKLVDTIEDADFCIFPIDVGFYLSNKRKNELELFVAAAKQYQKKVWIYSGGDFGTTFSDELVNFRLGGFHSKMNTNTFVMPSFINDPYQSIMQKEWQPLEKRDKPTVGFVGNADGSFIKWTKEALIYAKQTVNRLLKKDFSDHQAFFPSSSIRFKLLEKLKISEGILSDFIYRNKYRAGATTESQKIKTTLEFYENIERNLYTFCLRGSGNFSVRLYETLMMGRIPILIDTDVRLPFHEEINWKAHCVICNKKNFIQKIINFHNSHTNEELKNMQLQNRALVLNELNRQNYFIKVSKNLQNTHEL